MSDLDPPLPLAMRVVIAAHSRGRVWLNLVADQLDPSALNVEIRVDGRRGEGRGSAAMSDVVAVADDLGLVLTLDVSTMERQGQMGYADRRSWFERLGFEEVAPGSQRLVRHPR
jgi:GNAT superfamily N-acetyltransferase